jgi:hypothetical protein
MYDRALLQYRNQQLGNPAPGSFSRVRTTVVCFCAGSYRAPIARAGITFSRSPEWETLVERYHEAAEDAGFDTLNHRSSDFFQ